MKDAIELILQTIGAFAGGLFSINIIFAWSEQEKFSVLAFIASGLVGAIFGWVVVGLVCNVCHKLTKK